MSSINTKKLSLNIATKIYGRTTPDTAPIYLFIGKPYSWQDEVSPPAPSDTDLKYYDIWDNIVGFKKILEDDVGLVVPRINWEIGTIYSQYDDTDSQLENKNFYVLNSNFEVFKCISNNNGEYSIIEPTGKNLEVFSTSDGYKWKYLYTIPYSKQAKFLTGNWMPVLEDSLVSEAAIPGKIDAIKILNSGSGYYQGNTVLSVTGNGSNLTISPVVEDTRIIDYEITNPGKNYTYANIIVTGAGTDAKLQPIISPPGGHGKNNTRELRAKNLMFSAIIQYDTINTNIPPNISYRTVGLITNLESNSGIFLNYSTLNGNKIIKVLPDYGANFSKDQYITGNISNANAYVIYTKSYTGNTDLRIIQTQEITNDFKDFVVGEQVTASSTGSQGTIVSINSPDLKKYSGDILYVDNRSPINRTVSQSESIHIVIGF